MHLHQRLDRSLSARRPVRKILLIEDDPDFSEILKDYLTDCGYEIYHYPDVLDIQPLLTKIHPDLVILDYMLPVVNGGELCSQIKRDPDTCGLPVIMFSAYQKLLLSVGGYGCDAFISKPLDLNELVGKIEHYIN